MAKEKVKVKVDNPWNWILFVSYFGALVYFIDRNVGFWGDMLAFIQAAVWPAYVIFEVLKNLAV